MKQSIKSIKLGYILASAAIVLTGIYMLAHCTWSNTRKCNTAGEMPDARDLMIVNLPPDTKQQLIHYEGMDISFNSAMHLPNFAAWELTGYETDGKEKRGSRFVSDPDVEGCAETWDYNYSGYDRGHMAPAGDMKWSSKAMEQSFYLTNICPQAKPLNVGAWKHLEEKCRKWARIDSALIIICGPVLTDRINEYIGDTRIAVPKRFFKVILAPYTVPMRGIGFIMPNDRVEGGIQAAAVSIDSVEAVTGYDFFAALPDDIEAEVEQQCDFHKWSARK